MAFVITQGCVDIKDKTCLTVCPVDCIYEGERMTYINPLECIDCGACAPECPQDAIYYKLDLPSGQLEYATVNAEFFDGVDAPGGSSTVDLTDRDHATVRSLPPASGGQADR